VLLLHLILTQNISLSAGFITIYLFQVGVTIWDHPVYYFVAVSSASYVILFLHTDVSVRACTSCRPFVITSKSCWILLPSTVSY